MAEIIKLTEIVSAIGSLASVLLVLAVLLFAANALAHAFVENFKLGEKIKRIVLDGAVEGVARSIKSLGY